MQDVLDAAVAAGAVRAHLTVDDLQVLLGGLPDAGALPRARQRYLELVPAGLPARG